VKKFITYLVFAAVVVVLGYELYGLNSEALEAKNKLTDLDSAKEEILKDNEKLKQDIDYFSEPHNLEKELRARFNIRLPGEKLIIIVPPRQGE